MGEILTRRIGITMRVVRSDYGEVRDAIARDWPILLEKLVQEQGFAPEWFLLPNTGADCLSLVRRYQIEGLLLTGGDDIGATPDRDETENALLRWAAEESRPVLGICRGAQMLARHTGAMLTRVERGRHVASRHDVLWQDTGVRNPFWQKLLPRRGCAEVNSYHGWGLLQEDCPASLCPVAVCPDDKGIEAFCHVSLPWLGLFWHPEREKEPSPVDMTLLSNLFAVV